MSSINDLANLVGRAVKKAQSGAKVQVGTVQGNMIIVNGRTYAPTWGGDFDVRDGDRADCVIEGEKCVVVRCSR